MRVRDARLRLCDSACAHSVALSDCMSNVFIQPNPPTAVYPSESLLTSLRGYGRLKREEKKNYYRVLSVATLPAQSPIHLSHFSSRPFPARKCDLSVWPTRVIVLSPLFSGSWVYIQACVWGCVHVWKVWSTCWAKEEGSVNLIISVNMYSVCWAGLVWVFYIKLHTLAAIFYLNDSV